MSGPATHTIYVYPDSHPKEAADFLKYFLQAKPLIQRMGVRLHVVKVKESSAPKAITLAEFKKKNPGIKKLPALVTNNGSREGEESILGYYEQNMENFLNQPNDTPVEEIVEGGDEEIGAIVNGITQLPGMHLPFDNTYIDHAEIMKKEMAAEREEEEEEGMDMNSMNARMREMALAKRSIGNFSD